MLEVLRCGGCSAFLVIFMFSVVAPAQEPAAGSLRIVVLEGDGAINNVRARSARETRVRVEDAAGDPVANVPVTFTAPALGASGAFGDSGPSVTIVTDEEGEAVASSFRPNAVVGQFQIRVSASLAGDVARALVSQTNAAPAPEARGKRIMILGLVAGVVAGGAIAATSMGGSKTGGPAATPPAASLGVSPGDPSFGPPR